MESTYTFYSRILLTCKVGVFQFMSPQNLKEPEGVSSSTSPHQVVYLHAAFECSSEGGTYQAGRRAKDGERQMAFLTIGPTFTRIHSCSGVRRDVIHARVRSNPAEVHPVLRRCAVELCILRIWRRDVEVNTSLNFVLQTSNILTPT